MDPWLVGIVAFAIGVVVGIVLMAFYMPRYLARISSTQLSQLAIKVAEEREKK